MKKFLLAFLMINICFAFNSQLYAQDETGSMYGWILKGSYDYFSVDSEVDMPPTGFTNPQISSTTNEGDLQGGTFCIGKILHGMQYNPIIMLELSTRSGDFDGTINFTGFPAATTDTEREDFEGKITFQWVGERWQPFIGIGYLNIETDMVMTLPVGFTWVGTGTRFQPVEKDINTWSFGGGIGLKIGSIGPLQFSTKGEVYWLRGDGDLNVPGEGARSDDAYGWSGKITGLINWPFLVGNNVVSLFIDGGWQYQKISFGDSNEEIGRDVWSGLYGRAGLSLIF